MVSGLERGGSFRFLTLTSTRESSPDIHKHFRTLCKRLDRQGLIAGYIQVPEWTKSGLAHKHIILRGKFIPQAYLSQAWQEIHGAKVVYIQKIKNLRGKNNLANEMAKYMAKESSGRYSWNWTWVWKAFVRDWNLLKSCVGELIQLEAIQSFRGVIPYWRWILKKGRYICPIQTYLSWLQKQRNLTSLSQLSLSSVASSLLPVG